MHALFRYNPEAYLDEQGIAHVMMPERQEGIGGPRVSRMAAALRIPRAQAERLRARMTKSDDIEDILRDAARVAKARPAPVYYASVNDMGDFTDGILFVDFGDPKRMTLVFDYRDGRFVINDVGPSVERQKGRFAKANPRRASETLYVVDTSGKDVVIRDATRDEIRFGDAMPYEQAVYWAGVFAAETPGARVSDMSSHTKEPSMPTQFITNPRRTPVPRARRNPTPSPSAKALMMGLGILPAKAKALKEMMSAGRSVTSVLTAADKMMDGFGVEYIASAHDTMRTPDGLEFVNMGDTYNETLVYDHGKGKYVVTSWGDIVEADMRLPKSRQRFPD